MSQFKAMRNAQLCRTCMLNKGDMRSLFATGRILGKSAKLSDLLLSCAELQIDKDDGLPQQICMHCVNEVSRAYTFRKKCERSQQAFLIDLQNNEAEESQDESALYGFEEVITAEDVNVENQENEVVKDNGGNEPCDATDSQNSIPSASSVLKVRRLKVRHVPASYKADVTKNKITKPMYRRVTSDVKCRHCGKYFNILALRSHCFREHRGITAPAAQQCVQCGKTLRSEQQMKRHMNIHNTGKPYRCEECGKSYSQRVSYIAHTYSHTGERPFLCTECGKTFKLKVELKIHMRMHLDLRPYGCEICGKRYRNSSLFAIHKRVHSGERPFTCTFCDKKFMSSSTLKNHVMIHTGDKPFKCDICGRGFIRSYTLRIHRKTHTGERPHVCTICSKGFIQAHCLQTHMNTHKPEESGLFDGVM